MFLIVAKRKKLSHQILKLLKVIGKGSFHDYRSRKEYHIKARIFM